MKQAMLSNTYVEMIVRLAMASALSVLCMPFAHAAGAVT